MIFLNLEGVLSSKITNFLAERKLPFAKDDSLDNLRKSKLPDKSRNPTDYALANETFHFVYKLMAKTWDIGEFNPWQAVSNVFNALNSPIDTSFDPKKSVFNNQFAAEYLERLCSFLPKHDEQEQTGMRKVYSILTEILPALTFEYRNAIPLVKDRAELDIRFRSALESLAGYTQGLISSEKEPSLNGFREFWRKNEEKFDGLVYEKPVNLSIHYLASLVKQYGTNYAAAIRQIEQDVGELVGARNHAKSDWGGCVLTLLYRRRGQQLEEKLDIRNGVDKKVGLLLHEMLKYINAKEDTPDAIRTINQKALRLYESKMM